VASGAELDGVAVWVEMVVSNGVLARLWLLQLVLAVVRPAAGAMCPRLQDRAHELQ